MNPKELCPNITPKLLAQVVAVLEVLPHADYYQEEDAFVIEDSAGIELARGLSEEQAWAMACRFLTGKEF